MRIAAALVVNLALGSAASLVVAEEPIFVDRANASGLDFRYFNGMAGDFRLPEIVGGGVALFDYDRDGDLDVFFTQGRALDPKSGKKLSIPPPDRPGPRLFRNDLVTKDGSAGDLRFVDITEVSGIASRGYGIGVAAGDIDRDGWVDLYLTNLGSNELWRNRGDGTFEDRSAASGSDDPRWSVPAVFFDLDGDDWLDLYVGNYVAYALENNPDCRSIAGVRDYCGPLAFAPAGDRLLRNRGDGTFADITAAAGLGDAKGSTLGAVARDFDGDGRLDLYVANDGMPNQMWLNQGSGKLRNEALMSGTAVNMLGRPEASMGVAVGDYDGDGDEDIFLTHLRGETNTLYRNLGSGFFEDATTASGLGSASLPATGFGTTWIDYDNDGRLDLFAANGSVHVPDDAEQARGVFPLEEPNRLFRNLGGGRFQDVSAQAGAAVVAAEVSRGVAGGDLDNDGDTDLVVVNNSGAVRLLINQVGQHNGFVGIHLVASDGRVETPHARAELRLASGGSLWRTVSRDGSYASASDPRLIFGLSGSSAKPGRVTVHWTDGKMESWVATPGRYTDLRRGSGQKEGSP